MDSRYGTKIIWINKEEGNLALNSLSRQALNYLSDSEQGDKLAQNKLCCLLLLLDKEYKSKVVQLDEVLLFHVLNHLAECYIETFKEVGTVDQSFEQLIKKLALSDLKIGDSQAIAFNRCTYFARVLAGEMKGSPVDEELQFATDTIPDVDIGPESPDDDNHAQDTIEMSQSFRASQAVETLDEPDDDGVPTETEFNTIPAPEFQNIKIESKIPPHKSKQFSQIYKLWNQEYNPTLKENSSA